MLVKRKKQDNLPVPDFAGKRMLTVKEAAKNLGMCTDVVRQLIKQRRIPYIPKGTGAKRLHVVIDRCDLDRFIESRKIKILE